MHLTNFETLKVNLNYRFRYLTLKTKRNSPRRIAWKFREKRSTRSWLKNFGSSYGAISGAPYISFHSFSHASSLKQLESKIEIYVHSRADIRRNYNSGGKMEIINGVSVPSSGSWSIQNYVYTSRNVHPRSCHKAEICTSCMHNSEIPQIMLFYYLFALQAKLRFLWKPNIQRT